MNHRIPKVTVHIPPHTRWFQETEGSAHVTVVCDLDDDPNLAHLIALGMAVQNFTNENTAHGRYWGCEETLDDIYEDAGIERPKDTP